MAAAVASIEIQKGPAPDSGPKSALTPPTSEEWNEGNKADGDSSELSDLELDDEDIGEIEPDHYYGDGKIPVFRPTMDQFRSFKKFIDKIDKYGMKSGIVKVIPPPEWRDALPALDEAVKTIKVKNPITQEFAGTHGTYTQANIEKQRSYNLPQWKTLTDETNHQPPARRGERRRNQEKIIRGAVPKPKAAPKQSTASLGEKRRPGRPRKNTLSSEEAKPPEEESGSGDEGQIQVPPTPTSPDPKPTDLDEEEPSPTPAKRAAPKARVAKSSAAPNAKGRQPKSVSERRKYNQAEKTEVIDEEAFKDFDYHLDGLDEFTAERCAELETAYWKTITFAPPMYGADMPGSLFDDSTTSWNVAKLENLLDVLGTKVPGVNTAYLYLGMWKATFAWHLEDVDLYSINYIHFGAPKQWYSISQEDARRFEAAMRTVWPNDAKHCSQFLRHKTYLISPALLESQFNIKVNKLVHNEGEFVITFPYGYHSGYNIGYNCAESVNFATEAWLDYGRIAKKCNCEADSVWVDVGEIERKLRGEPTPEYYEETDEEDFDDDSRAGDLPSPPASVKGKLNRKRKRDSKALAGPRKVKKIKIRLKASAAEPCVLCPNDMPFEKILPTDTGKKAHEICALYTPELYIWNEDGPERVCDINKINKARLGLRCSYCRSKKGTCFQCSARKCTRAYHATCAAAAGVQVEYGPTPWYGVDGIEYKSEDYDFRCRWHRPKRSRTADSESLEKSSLIRTKAISLKPNEAVQVQHVGGDVFAGLVIETRPTERTIVIDVLPEGDRVEVEWKYILELDPADSQMVRPSADAQDLPNDFDKHKTRSQPSLNGPPVPDDPFLDPDGPYKWSEFNTAPAPHNKAQVKIDFEKNNQIWYYLGKTSTEAKSQFSEDPANPRHNVQGNFLETVKPAPPIIQSIPRASYPPPIHRGGVNYHAANGAMASARQCSQQAWDDLQKARNNRPYQYKPKTDIEYSVDAQALTSQRSFLQEAHQYAHQRQAVSPGYRGPYANIQPASDSRSQQYGRQLPPVAHFPSQSPPLGHTHNDPKRASSGSSSMSPNQSHFPNHSPFDLRGQQPSASLSGSYGGQSFHTPSTQSQQPRAPPVAKMTSDKAGQPPQLHHPSREFDMEYLSHISLYPYLKNSYLRKPKAYSSPYPGDEGFSEAYLRTLNSTPSSSQPYSSPYAHGRAPSQNGLGYYQLVKQPEQHQPPKQQQPEQHQLPKPQHAHYQTAEQFQHQVKQEASSRPIDPGHDYQRILSKFSNSEFSNPSVSPELNETRPEAAGNKPALAPLLRQSQTLSEGSTPLVHEAAAPQQPAPVQLTES